MKQSEPLATITDAGLFRSGRWLVRGVSMAVQAGEIVTLIGPNGAGKSTAAKLVLGVLKPDEGSAWRRPGLRLSYVPQRLAIDWTLPLSVRRFMSLTGPIGDTDTTHALAETEVAHLANAQMQTLSGGEFQRVLLARAIARKPELLVLDEPVQGVDFAGEVALYDLIRRIRDRHGCGILLISHNLHLVMAATDRVICLNGHVCCSGTPKVVAASAEYKALFGARAASTLAVYEHHHDHTHLPDGRVRFADGTVSNEDDAGGRERVDGMRE
ncbi:MAG: ATP-binding cassette domain-containing protein [Pseudomonadota bacterium]